MADAQYITPPESSINSRSNSSCSTVDIPAQDACPLVADSSPKPPASIGSSDMGDTGESKDSRTKDENEHPGDSAGKPEDQKLSGKHIDDSFSDSEIGNSRRGFTTLEKEAIGRRHIQGPTLPQRRAKAARRLLQTKAYAELVEERILELEQKVRELANHKTPLVETNANLGDSLPSLLKAVPMGWSEFNSRTSFNFSPKNYPGEWQHRPEVDDVPRPIIEILTEEPRYGTFLTDFSNRKSDVATSRQMGIDAYASSTPVSTSEPYQIRFRSNLLLKFLKNVTGCSVLLGPHEHRLLMFRPFKLLAHFATSIQKYAQNLAEETELSRPETELKSPGAVKQLNMLVTMMNEYLPRSLSLQQGASHKVTKVTFSDLWYFFKPGHEVRTPGESQIQVYRIAKVTGGRDIVTQRDTPEDRFADHDSNHASKKLKDEGYSEGSFIIECFYIHYDSTRFGPVNATFQIRKFDGERDITLLPVVPLKCYRNECKIREELLARGQKFIELSNPARDSMKRAHRKYLGLTVDKNPEQVESEVIIDFELAFMQTKIDKPSLGLQDRLVSDDPREVRGNSKMMHMMCDQAGCCGNDVTFNDYEIDEIERNEFRDKHRYLFDSNIEDPEHLQQEHIILLPPHVYGFVLRTRRWATFDINLLQKIPHNEEGWKNLVIDNYIKQTVLALVKNHERLPRSQNPTGGAPLIPADLIQGKGRGLIILLHGEPGVGKTSTAECVAALTRRPLFPITCGDIGDKAETVETNLEKNFQLAHKWGCVLLLDEADIFLSTRTENDIQRNAIVSVFLRTLEYYSGILFLTTNRVGTIDRAFKSRIHCSLLYKKLDKTRTIMIWENNIERVKKDLDIICDKEGIITFAKKHFKQLKISEDLMVWNGRQIRNAFQTAIAIANYEHQNRGEKGGVKPVLEASHFKRVAKSAREFDKYLKLTSSYTDAGLAKAVCERDDDYLSSDEETSGEKKRSRKRFRSSDTKKGARRKSNLKRDESSIEDSQRFPDKDLGSNIESDGVSSNDSRSSSEDDSEDEKARRQWKKRKRNGRYI